MWGLCGAYLTGTVKNHHCHWYTYHHRCLHILPTWHVGNLVDSECMWNDKVRAVVTIVRPLYVVARLVDTSITLATTHGEKGRGQLLLNFEHVQKSATLTCLQTLSLARQPTASAIDREILLRSPAIAPQFRSQLVTHITCRTAYVTCLEYNKLCLEMSLITQHTSVMMRHIRYRIHMRRLFSGQDNDR